ncbi:NAD(P)H-dependent glycerol-3-phosphate dehydrogenase [Deinococcus psychrotolerans]|uniref:Glycerol-3-phosphate dehydrogenase [NAD(P)+] n=1 Tax=Deinococcus psychrotolerans TaxID=2489213 RepID=A0A3G8YBG5_9DEIO|nr:NAD(P)H-dependent glycerol-3-phosphate dehydrogenase [Deinococcus psychrotolerans]AZI42648.1 NAD(P)H-dependent glycerol-3-phosphate dehydrogenase [Deinococcus psychrotolerans]
MNEADPLQKMVVLGAGGWGTALAVTLAQTHAEVTLWARREALAAQLRESRINSAYLPDVSLPANVRITSDLSAAVEGADWAFLVVPSVGMSDLLSALPPQLGAVLCAKGLAPAGQRLSELATGLGFGRVAVLSGPNHAEEIGLGLPAATVVASKDAEFARTVQAHLMTPNLRVYTSSDVVGVELGGVLKNVVAVAAGLGDGLKLGDNARASVITRGLREMARYLASQGAQEDTVYGLSGLGDLVATATSRHSRNRAAGEALARGAAPEGGGKVVEGLRTARLLSAWARESGAELPIVQGVAAVAGGQLSPQEALSALMQREAKAEG